MDIDLLKDKLGEENVYVNEEMSKYTTFKTGGIADVLIKISNLEKLQILLKIVKENNIPLYILGNGSNILVTDKGIRGFVCKIEINKFKIEENENDILVTCGSGNKNGEIAQKLLNLEIEGFEFASGIPRNYWWSYKNECRCIRKRNERYCIFY